MFLPLRKSRLPDADTLTPYLKEIDTNQWYSNFGPLVRRFESVLASQFGVSEDCVLSVCSATAGLQLVLGMYGASTTTKEQCAIPGFTFPAVGCVADAGAFEPVVCDVDESSWQLEPKGLSDEIVKGLRAVIPVSCFGAPLKVTEWTNFAKKTGVSVLLDAAWCFGSLQPSNLPSVVSLHASKAFGVGEGGFIISTDLQLIKELRQRANFGLGVDRHVAHRGSANAKMSEFTAAVGLAAFEAWPQRQEMALKLADSYLGRLSSISGIQLLPGFDGSWASAALAIRIPAEGVPRIIQDLADKSIEVRQWWSPMVTENPAFKGYKIGGKLAVSRTLATEVLNVPFHEYVTGQHIDIIADTIDAVLEG